MVRDLFSGISHAPVPRDRAAALPNFRSSSHFCLHTLSHSYQIWGGNTSGVGACVLASATPPVSRERSSGDRQFLDSCVFLFISFNAERPNSAWLHIRNGVFLRSQPHAIAFAQCVARFLSVSCFLCNMQCCGWPHKICPSPRVMTQRFWVLYQNGVIIIIGNPNVGSGTGAIPLEMGGRWHSWSIQTRQTVHHVYNCWKKMWKKVPPVWLLVRTNLFIPSNFWITHGYTKFGTCCQRYVATYGKNK